MVRFEPAAQRGERGKKEIRKKKRNKKKDRKQNSEKAKEIQTQRKRECGDQDTRQGMDGGGDEVVGVVRGW